METPTTFEWNKFAMKQVLRIFLQRTWIIFCYFKSTFDENSFKLLDSVRVALFHFLHSTLIALASHGVRMCPLSARGSEVINEVCRRIEAKGWKMRFQYILLVSQLGYTAVVSCDWLFPMAVYYVLVLGMTQFNQSVTIETQFLQQASFWIFRLKRSHAAPEFLLPVSSFIWGCFSHLRILKRITILSGSLATSLLLIFDDYRKIYSLCRSKDALVFLEISSIIHW